VRESRKAAPIPDKGYGAAGERTTHEHPSAARVKTAEAQTASRKQGEGEAMPPPKSGILEGQWVQGTYERGYKQRVTGKWQEKIALASKVGIK